MPITDNQLQGIRKQLVEIGTRNRLINVNRQSTRAKVINIINKRSDDVFSILRVNDKKMRFIAKGLETDHSNPSGDINLSVSINEQVAESRHKDKCLETALSSDALQRRLLSLAKDAKTAEEEQGINVLYLSLGFLRWYESESSEIEINSPLILLPVELVRDKRSSTFKLSSRGDDVVTNLSLQARLNADGGVILPKIDDTKSWTPKKYFARLRKAIKHQNRWQIDHDGMQLGFFSFAKLIMLEDLKLKSWPNKSLQNSYLINGLLSDGFSPNPSLFPKEKKIDEILDPEKLFYVVTADASQAQVIEEANSGRNLIVQGPPGTGKSQTIVNIIASAVQNGKKVLFMAEKMAALNVVHERMEKAGLRHLCLEIHSKNANKKVFYEEINRTLVAGKKDNHSIPTMNDKLKTSRDKLNELSTILHTPFDQLGLSGFQVLSKLINFSGDDIDTPELTIADPTKILPTEEELIHSWITEYCNIREHHPTYQDHPYRDSNNQNLQPTDINRLERKINKILELIESWHNFQKQLATTLEKSSVTNFTDTKKLIADANLLTTIPENFRAVLPVTYKNAKEKRFKEALQIAKQWAEQKQISEENFFEAAWDTNSLSIRAGLTVGINSWYKRILGKYKSASQELSAIIKTPLPKTAAARLGLLDKFISAQNMRKDYNTEAQYLKEQCGTLWRETKTDFTLIQDCLQTLENNDYQLLEFSENHLLQFIGNEKINSLDFTQYQQLATNLIDSIVEVGNTLDNNEFSANNIQTIDLPNLSQRLKSMLGGKHLYATWLNYCGILEELQNIDLKQLFELLDANSNLTAKDALAEFECALNEARWEFMRNKQPKLNRYRKIDRHKLVKTFNRLEDEHITNAKSHILAKHLNQVPSGSSGEMGLIRAEIAKTRRHKPIRKIMQHAGKMVQKIKPVFLMSPISIAQYLPPETLEFDLLIIDEASQVRPAEAIGAIARTKQLIVVGDNKQLPPTSFFSRMTGDDDNYDEDDEDDIHAVDIASLESILTLCEARGIKQTMLKWHYRSRDPSLISVSNLEFYNQKLILPPSPIDSKQMFGLKFKYVPGVYATSQSPSGRPSTNQIEAQAIADRLCELAQQHSQYSVGIVTFSKVQSDMITEVLELRRRDNEILDSFLAENKYENVFVKNIENVQGDERDIILISVGYGPLKPNGQLASMRFGPINPEGGERRLNVLFSRARVICEVYCSFNPDNIDLTHTNSVGVRVFKRFLKYAKSGQLEQSTPTGQGADSPFEEDVASVIRSFGYEADHQVGTAGFKIDLGVREKGDNTNYILAVECDGATYHSALWARERDRLRQQTLEAYGWTFHRIWSTDWFYTRPRELERLKEALKAAGQKNPKDSIIGANIKPPQQPNNSQRSVLPKTQIRQSNIKAKPYKQWKCNNTDNNEPHETNIFFDYELAVKIVATEGPVHTDIVTRRYATAYEKKRSGSRIVRFVLTALQSAEHAGKLIRKGDCWGTSKQFDNIQIRNRSQQESFSRNSKYISDQEIKKCMEIIAQESGQVELSDLAKSVTTTLGLNYAGNEFKSRVRSLQSAK